MYRGFYFRRFPRRSRGPAARLARSRAPRLDREAGDSRVRSGEREIEAHRHRLAALGQDERTKAHIDASVRGLDRCRANLIPGELGWSGLWPPSRSNPGLQLDEIEYLLARSLAFDAPISIETSLANIDAHPLSGAVLALQGTYERLRLSRQLAPEALEPLRRPGGDWALLRPAGAWRRAARSAPSGGEELHRGPTNGRSKNRRTDAFQTCNQTQFSLTIRRHGRQ